MNSGPLASESTATAVEKGVAARRAGNLAGALSWFEQACVLEPNHATAQLRRAETLRNLGRIGEAEEAYAALRDKSSALKLDALLGLGLCAKARSDGITALGFFAQAVGYDPTNRTARLREAEMLRDLGRFDEAETAFKSLILADPAATHEASLGLGQCARRRGDHAAALEYFDAAIEALPGDRNARLRRAEVLRDLGRTDAAVQAYLAIIQNDPAGTTEARLGLGALARQLGDAEGALLHFEAATLASPYDRNARLRFAESLRDLGRYDDAHAAYRGLLVDDPGSKLEVNLGLAECARREADLATALMYLEQASLAAPADRNVRLKIAQTLADLGRIDEAEQAYTSLLDKPPQDYWAAIGLGKLLRLRGDRQRAEAAFVKASKLQPDHKSAWLELANELRDRGELAEARDVISGLLAKNENDPDALTSLGHIERVAGEHGLALAAFSKAFAIEPSRTSLLIDIAEEQWAVGRVAASEQSLKLAASKVDASAAAGALLRLARRERSNNNLAQAFQLAVQASKLEPQNVWTFAEIASCLYDAGQFEKALDVLRAASLLPNASNVTAANQASFLRRVGQLQEALHVVRAAVADGVTSFSLSMQRFQIEMALGKPHLAAAFLDSIATRNDIERAEIEHCRGLLAEGRYRVDDAIRHYTAAIQLNPNNPGMHHSLARMSLIQCDLELARHHIRLASKLLAPSRLQMGLAPNPSQSQAGQLIQEYELCPDGLVELKAVAALEPLGRIPALLEVVRRYPDYTPAAMSLTVALRECRLLQAPQLARPVPPLIAKHVVQFWDDPSPPSQLSTYMRSWREQNPDYGWTLFNQTSALTFLENHCNPEVASAYQSADLPAKKADLFRLAYLYVKGGYYADADDVCRAPLSSFVPGGVKLVLWNDDYGALGNNFIGAVPGNPVLGLGLSLCAAALNRGDGELVWLSSGPGLVTRAFARTLAASANGIEPVLADIMVLERHQLLRGISVHCFAPYKKTNRHWLKSSFGEASARPSSKAGIQPTG